MNDYIKISRLTAHQTSDQSIETIHLTIDFSAAPSKEPPSQGQAVKINSQLSPLQLQQRQKVIYDYHKTNDTRNLG